MALAEFAANNAVNVATEYSTCYLNSSDQPLVPSVFVYDWDVSSQIKAVQTMVDWMKTALVEAQANFRVGPNHKRTAQGVMRHSG